MIVESELREQIARALEGVVSLDDLYAWLMDRSWNMHKDSEPSAVALAADVEALFFERSDGLISDVRVRERLAALMGELQVRIKLVIRAIVPAASIARWQTDVRVTGSASQPVRYRTVPAPQTA